MRSVSPSVVAAWRMPSLPLRILAEETMPRVEKAVTVHGDVDNTAAAVASNDATFLLRIMVVRLYYEYLMRWNKKYTNYKPILVVESCYRIDSYWCDISCVDSVSSNNIKKGGRSSSKINKRFLGFGIGMMDGGGGAAAGHR
mmetsp:Transcript_15251/g.27719  ORF Transcript_15251/g.27719 Transcript_15251/m.27719 type:complete len:142 (-) Transcript_15251:48-473(-)